MRTLTALTCCASLLVAFFAYAGHALADDDANGISGDISSTLTIFADTKLVGDVNCTSALLTQPCIVFGTDDITLRLNGHTITGPVNPPTDCSLPSDATFGVGIEVNGRSHVKIEGPGVIQNFQRWGIFLLSSTDITVEGVTVNRNCWSGMQTTSTSDSRFEKDVWVNNAGASNGAACGGICLANSNNNMIQNCTFHGNGSVDYPSRNVDFGIGFEGTSTGNEVKDNDLGGNTNGVLFFNSSSNNVVRHNIIAGNPAAQVIKTFTATNQQGADIAFRPNFTGANNTIRDNFCLTYLQGAGPATSPCRRIGKQEARWFSN
jgi:parallel beta-helix repeat protein